jgi:hypothetical protein
VRDQDGHVEVDDAYHTSVRNVFAAGDIVPGPQLGIAAAADGAIAALAIHKSLVPEERKLKRQHRSEDAKPHRLVPRGAAPTDGAGDGKQEPTNGANGANGDARNDPATDDETAPPWQEATAAS